MVESIHKRLHALICLLLFVYLFDCLPYFSNKKNESVNLHKSMMKLISMVAFEFDLQAKRLPQRMEKQENETAAIHMTVSCHCVLYHILYD